MLLGILGGLFPDLDLLWAPPDARIPWSGLAELGRQAGFHAYWIPQASPMHSLTGGLLATVLLALLLCVVYTSVLRHAPSYGSALRYLMPYIVAFGLGYVIHVLADLCVPAGPAGGFRLLYPLEIRTGGWGWTWWWNNYDLILILAGVLIISLLVLVFAPWFSRTRRFLPMTVFGMGLLLCVIQMNRRPLDFNDPDFSLRESTSLDLQRELLGEPVYEWMRRMDRALPVEI